MTIPSRVIKAATAMLHSMGWGVLRDLPLTFDDEPDIPRLVEIATTFGTPSERDGGTPAWLVRPRTDDPTQTFSQRTGCAPLHTDAQYRRVPEPFVCLFAIRPADDGGTTRLLTVPDVLTALHRHPHGGWLRRRLARSAWSWRVPTPFSEEPPFRAAVLPADGTIRWRRDNLAPCLPGELEKAAEEFGQCLETAPGLVEVNLGPGDMVVLDNRHTLHGRTAFSDPRRLMVRVRLWDKS